VTTRITFTTSSPFQEAIAIALERAGKFFEIQRKEYEERRKIMLYALDRLGLPYTKPEGTYFILVNITNLQIPRDFKILDQIKDRPRDWKAAWFVGSISKVIGIPPSDFYGPEHSNNIGAHYIRFAFCKDLETLREAGKRLQNLKPFLMTGGSLK